MIWLNYSQYQQMLFCESLTHNLCGRQTWPPGLMRFRWSDKESTGSQKLPFTDAQACGGSM